jgi:hypothetical protein
MGAVVAHDGHREFSRDKCAQMTRHGQGDMTDLHGAAVPESGPDKDEELEQPPLSVLQMTVAGVLGAAAAGAGAIAVFKTENEVGRAQP